MKWCTNEQIAKVNRESIIAEQQETYKMMVEDAQRLIAESPTSALPPSEQYIRGVVDKRVYCDDDGSDCEEEEVADVLSSIQKQAALLERTSLLQNQHVRSLEALNNSSASSLSAHSTSAATKPYTEWTIKKLEEKLDSFQINRKGCKTKAQLTDKLRIHLEVNPQFAVELGVISRVALAGISSPPESTPPIAAPAAAASSIISSAAAATAVPSSVVPSVTTAGPTATAITETPQTSTATNSRRGRKRTSTAVTTDERSDDGGETGDIDNHDEQPFMPSEELYLPPNDFQPVEAVPQRKRRTKSIGPPMMNTSYPCACGCDREFNFAMTRCRGCESVYIHTGCVGSYWNCVTCREESNKNRIY